MLSMQTNVRILIYKLYTCTAVLCTSYSVHKNRNLKRTGMNKHHFIFLKFISCTKYILHIPPWRPLLWIHKGPFKDNHSSKLFKEVMCSSLRLPEGKAANDLRLKVQPWKCGMSETTTLLHRQLKWGKPQPATTTQQVSRSWKVQPCFQVII